jgi:molybdopterin-guanine dinucleotide biosynthesis protein A
MDSLENLILAGGHSSHMASPKHLLPLPAYDVLIFTTESLQRVEHIIAK